ncbi:hypothetical protein GLAREA_11744 [Glarea lozoyensis ATCC 20868]|uniref:EGF-like domain-containing protein n=1 Tax=Glarea lozoyensis (strain ATCC 20868 / MF5171) TaxID=1116229 RepID=S3DET3_GLAL2|nr:uncharacterized protein GLAREA_11744 [Glarea lozoyensis ATCC 20868]EPE25163.1 hypothetical protein GLAREA_11744 [Glarea lozoyensis ATCC 20868]
MHLQFLTLAAILATISALHHNDPADMEIPSQSDACQFQVTKTITATHTAVRKVSVTETVDASTIATARKVKRGDTLSSVSSVEALSTADHSWEGSATKIPVSTTDHTWESSTATPEASTTDHAWESSISSTDVATETATHAWESTTVTQDSSSGAHSWEQSTATPAASTDAHTWEQTTFTSSVSTTAHEWEGSTSTSLESTTTHTWEDTTPSPSAPTEIPCADCNSPSETTTPTTQPNPSNCPAACNPHPGFPYQCDITAPCSNAGSYTYCACRAGYRASGLSVDDPRQARFESAEGTFRVHVAPGVVCDELCEPSVSGQENVCNEVTLRRGC